MVFTVSGSSTRTIFQATVPFALQAVVAVKSLSYLAYVPDSNMTFDHLRSQLLLIREIVQTQMLDLSSYGRRTSDVTMTSYSVAARTSASLSTEYL